MRYLIATCFFLSLLLTPSLAISEKTVRVRFPRGRTTAVLNGRLQRDGIIRYVLTARAGQTMLIHLTSPRGGARFDLYPASDRDRLGDAEDVTDWSGTLPVSGDYIISVYALNRGTRYTLEVTIR